MTTPLAPASSSPVLALENLRRRAAEASTPSELKALLTEARSFRTELEEHYRADHGEFAKASLEALTDRQGALATAKVLKRSELQDQLGPAGRFVPVFLNHRAKVKGAIAYQAEKTQPEQGALRAAEQNIDIAKAVIQDLAARLEEAGEAHPEPTVRATLEVPRQFRLGTSPLPDKYAAGDLSRQLVEAGAILLGRARVETVGGLRVEVEGPPNTLLDIAERHANASNGRPRLSPLTEAVASTPSSRFPDEPVVKASLTVPRSSPFHSASSDRIHEREADRLCQELVAAGVKLLDQAHYRAGVGITVTVQGPVSTLQNIGNSYANGGSGRASVGVLED